jgi:hypothetical protein
MLIQHATAAASHPLAGTIAEYLWLVPLLPLLGFVINGLLSVVPATRLGPADPTAAGHDAHAAGHAAGHAPSGGAHGDDHHPVARHRFAGLVSVVGPAVLAATFALAVAIFLAMRGAGELHAP